jgi:protein-glucosylgalactosylhydroxylysine glucosidase
MEKPTKSLIYCPPLFSLPSDSKLLPTLSNGHLGFTVLSEDVYMNGLYNGHCGLSHRARIPNFGNILLADCKTQECSYTLNARLGYFMVKLVVENQFSATHLIYAHRFHNRALVNQIHIQRLGSRGEFEIASR